MAVSRPYAPELAAAVVTLTDDVVPDMFVPVHADVEPLSKLSLSSVVRVPVPLEGIVAVAVAMAVTGVATTVGGGAVVVGTAVAVAGAVVAVVTTNVVEAETPPANAASVCVPGTAPSGTVMLMLKVPLALVLVTGMPALDPSSVNVTVVETGNAVPVAVVAVPGRRLVDLSVSDGAIAASAEPADSGTAAVYVYPSSIARATTDAARITRDRADRVNFIEGGLLACQVGTPRSAWSALVVLSSYNAATPK